MGYFCLLNCLALATGPHVILSKCIGITESNALWKCGQVGIAYALTQLLKMIFIATFFPTVSIEGFSGFGLFMEAIRTSVDIIDLFGISVVLDYLSGKGQYKICIVGVGWAASDLILTKYLPIWFGTRGLEFDWTYIMLSFEANLDLIFHMVTVLMIWLIKRKDINRSNRSLIIFFVICLLYRPLFFQLIKRLELFQSPGLLLLKIFFTFGFGLFGLYLHLTWKKDVTSNGVMKLSNHHH